MRGERVVRRYKGRTVLPGTVTGEACVTRQGFNTLASFYTSMVTRSDRAICSDQDNPDLFGKNLSGMVICLPKTIGSTSAGVTWDTVVSMGIAPKAMLFSQHIDSLAAAGLILADVWAGVRIVVIDQLGDDFLAIVEDGCKIEVFEDGTVWVTKILSGAIV